MATTHVPKGERYHESKRTDDDCILDGSFAANVVDILTCQRTNLFVYKESHVFCEEGSEGLSAQLCDDVRLVVKHRIEAEEVGDDTGDRCDACIRKELTSHVVVLSCQCADSLAEKIRKHRCDEDV